MFDDKVMMHLPLDGLRTFVAAAELKNFTRAGEEVCRSQSAVSMQMKRLEEELGRRLFLRNARAVELTTEGELLLGYARRMLRLHDEAVASLMGPEMTGHVRLGVPDDYATRYLPEVLARFARSYPCVRVDVSCDTSPRLSRAFDEGLLDVCLTSNEVVSGLDAEQEHVADVPLVWIGARDLEAIWKRGEEPLPLAVFQEGCMNRRWAEQALERQGIAYRIAFSSVSLAAILGAVRSGLAVAPVLLSCVDAQARVLGRESGLPDLPSVAVAMHARYDAERPAIGCLAGFVRDCLAEYRTVQAGEPA